MSRSTVHQPTTAAAWDAARGALPVSRVLAQEGPIGLSYDGRPRAVMMATPADIEDFATGFTLSERIATFDQIKAIEVERRAEGIAVNIRLAPTGKAGRIAGRARTSEGRSSCGLCGVQRLAQAVRALPRVGEGLRVSHRSVQRALAALEEAQILGRLTRAMHAAAWANADGMVMLAREDVGRHNALDKLIGAAARAGLDPALAFILVTSRCSFEMVEKAAVAGVQMLVAISAPTDLAIDKANEAGLTLIALARADGHTIFTGPERLVDRQLEAAE